MREVYRVRVAFADTDAMGVAWHGSYLRWFEQARTEMMRGSELTYRRMVEIGYHLPLVEACVRYRRPARYDDLLVVLAAAEAPRGVRLRVDYRVECEGALIAEGHTEHAFTNAEGRPVRPPPEILAVLRALPHHGRHAGEGGGTRPGCIDPCAGRGSKGP